jgi:predicted transcriptional regulator of viral defense system
MEAGSPNNYLLNWIEGLLARGKTTFSYEQLCIQFKDVKEPALISALTRIVKKKKAVSVYKGFYVILRPENYSNGIVSPQLFIDYLMAYLNRPYYVGLLSAAAMHGSSHQRPQEFFVVTILPHIRPTVKKGIRINYIGRLHIPEKYLVTRKVETGLIKISNPELTAVDLIRYENHIGGLNRVATIISDLTEVMDAERFDKDFVKEIPVTYLQRLGYILENFSERPGIASRLFDEINKTHKILPRMPLKAGKGIKGFKTDQRWRLIINTEIDTD